MVMMTLMSSAAKWDDAKTRCTSPQKAQLLLCTPRPYPTDAPKNNCSPSAKVGQPFRESEKQLENGNRGLAKCRQIVAVQPHVRHAGWLDVNNRVDCGMR
jgi:hypothetical protein